MISTKDRAFLRSLAQKQEPLVLIGKGGITDNVLESISILLEKRELIKIRLLQNSGMESKQASQLVCDNLGADGVQCIGNVFVVYRKSKRDDVKHLLK